MMESEKRLDVSNLKSNKILEKKRMASVWPPQVNNFFASLGNDSVLRNPNFSELSGFIPYDISGLLFAGHLLGLFYSLI